jgi:hypothetical protein
VAERRIGGRATTLFGDPVAWRDRQAKDEGLSQLPRCVCWTLRGTTRDQTVGQVVEYPGQIVALDLPTDPSDHCRPVIRRVVECALGDDKTVEDKRADGNLRPFGDLSESSCTGGPVKKQLVAVADDQHRYHPRLVADHRRHRRDPATVEDLVEHAPVTGAIWLPCQRFQPVTRARRFVHTAERNAAFSAVETILDSVSGQWLECIDLWQDPISVRPALGWIRCMASSARSPVAKTAADWPECIHSCLRWSLLLVGAPS